MPGCISEGDSAEEAMANLRDAVELYLEPVEDDLAGRPGSEIQQLVI